MLRLERNFQTMKVNFKNLKYLEGFLKSMVDRGVFY